MVLAQRALDALVTLLQIIHHPAEVFWLRKDEIVERRQVEGIVVVGNKGPISTFSGIVVVEESDPHLKLLAHELLHLIVARCNLPRESDRKSPWMKRCTRARLFQVHLVCKGVLRT